MDKVFKTLVDFLKTAHLQNHLIYGSLAYCIYTNEIIKINDIDIIVFKNDFPKILNQLKTNTVYKLYPSEKTIHVNLINVKGNDGKPFDISLDSFEDYFSDKEINLNTYTEFESDGFRLKILPVAELLKIYKLTAMNHRKQFDYKIKIQNLEKLLSKN